MLDMSSMNYMTHRFIAVVAFGVAVATASPAQASSHSYINQMRSSVRTNVLVSQGIEGEYGSYRAKSSTESFSQNWQGYGFRSGLGLEVMKFVQFNVGHTFSNMSNAGSNVERMIGSKVFAETRLVFMAPLANLELGGGILGSRLDYQRAADVASFYGSGLYYSLGLNYFMSPSVSVYGTAKLNQENLMKSSGAAADNFKTNTTALGLGFSLWI